MFFKTTNENIDSEDVTGKILTSFYIEKVEGRDWQGNGFKVFFV